MTDKRTILYVDDEEINLMLFEINFTEKFKIITEAYHFLKNQNKHSSRQKPEKATEESDYTQTSRKNMRGANSYAPHVRNNELFHGRNRNENRFNARRTTRNGDGLHAF